MISPDDEFTLKNPDASLLDDKDEPVRNDDYTRRDEGGIITSHNGLADRLLMNNDLYNKMKGDWTRTGWNKSGNIKTTTGRVDGKFFVTNEQMNYNAVIERCRLYREAAESGVPDPLAPIGDDGKLQHKWMDLPFVVEQRISDDYFGGMRWNTIKRDKTLKAQFYKVVQQEYPQFICYPGGKLPIPVDVAYPTKVGEQRFFSGR